MDTSLANADIELYFSAQADGYGLVESPGSDSVVNSTPTEDYQVERAIYYNNTGLASYVSDSGWTTLTQNTENYAAAKARVEDYIRGGTYGKLPCTFAIVRTEELKYVGLLDTYTGAAAAYSLRWLNTDYTGPAIRVRRASDNAEQDIGFDANGDLDTTALATFCSGTDGFVKTWYDQAGSNDATQTTTGSQPKVYDSSTGVSVNSNGNASLYFDGTDKFENITSAISTVHSSFVVAEGRQEAKQVYGFGGGTAFLKFEFAIWNDKLTAAFIGDGGAFTAHKTTAPKDSLTHLFSQFYDAVDYEIYLDNTLDTSVSETKTSTGALSIGARITGEMYLSELVLYSSDQSSNRTGIESNINTYYSIYA
jgi:hypothetical protein